MYACLNICGKHMCILLWKSKGHIFCLSQSLYTLLTEVGCQTEPRDYQCFLV